MELARRVDLINADSAALADAAARDLTAPIPSCPDWVMADLVRHVLQVHRSWCRIVAGFVQTDTPFSITISAKPDLPVVGSLRGPASDLLLVLWKRMPITAVATTGDVDAIAQAIASIDID